MERSSPLRVALGSAFAGAFVVPMTWWIESMFTGADMNPWWKVVALTTGFFLFEPTVNQWLQAKTAAALAEGKVPVRRRVWSAVAP
jgi:hypothetical protein